MAAGKNSEECVALLLSHGAETNIEDEVRKHININLKISYIYNYFLCKRFMLIIFYVIINNIRMDRHLYIGLLRRIVMNVLHYCCPMELK